jgi:hypothetical protein
MYSGKIAVPPGGGGLHCFSFGFPLLSIVPSWLQKKTETVRIKLVHFYSVKPCEREVKIMIKIQ